MKRKLNSEGAATRRLSVIFRSQRAADHCDAAVPRTQHGIFIESYEKINKYSIANVTGGIRCSAAFIQLCLEDKERERGVCVSTCSDLQKVMRTLRSKLLHQASV